MNVQNVLNFDGVYQSYFNPLCPPLLGEFGYWGAPPNPQQRGFAPLHSPLGELGAVTLNFSLFILHLTMLFSLSS